MTDVLTNPLLQELTRCGQLAVERGAVAGPGGNISARDGDVMWISPSGLALDEIGPEQWAALDIETGSPLRTPLRPSSEYLMHLSVYREREDVRAIVHTHPPYTIAVISAGLDTIPYMFPDQVAIVGALPVLDYIVPCTPELAMAVQAALRDVSVSGLLLRNHGLITVGATIREAWFRNEVAEQAAQIWTIARAVGTPRTLTDDECRQILDLEAEKYRQALLRSPNGSGAS